MNFVESALIIVAPNNSKTDKRTSQGNWAKRNWKLRDAVNELLSFRFILGSSYFNENSIRGFQIHPAIRIKFK